MLTLSKKVCLLGDFAVGKTSLVRRFVYDLFDDQYLSTIGVKVSRKTITVARGQDLVELTMMLWDLAGSEECGPAICAALPACCWWEIWCARRPSTPCRAMWLT